MAKVTQQPLSESIWQRGKPLLLRWGPKALLVMTLLFIGHWSWQKTAQLLPVKQIAVTGVLQQVTGEKLREVVRPLVKEGFVRTDVIAVRDAVRALPWVSTVTIRRQWPDTLALEVEEQQLLATWGDNALVNQQGELFYPESFDLPSATPRFFGIDGMNLRMSESYLGFKEQLLQVGLEIVRLEVTERRAWQMTLSNGIELLMGREPQGQHLQRFIKAYSSGLAQRAEQIGRVDLRYSNGFAIRWKESGIG